MNVDLAQVARDAELPLADVKQTVELLDDGNTIPFITRFRKDQTGGLDEDQIRRVQLLLAKHRALVDRKQTVLKSIDLAGQLTQELEDKINSAFTLKRIEDLYLPFKPKKSTLAAVARQRGLEPFVEEVFIASSSTFDLQERAADFVSAEDGLLTVDDVLQGVRHILAERFSERADLRGKIRRVLVKTGKLVCEAVEQSSKRQSTPAPVAATASQDDSNTDIVVSNSSQQSQKTDNDQSTEVVAAEISTEETGAAATPLSSPSATSASDASVQTFDATTDKNETSRSKVIPEIGTGNSEISGPAGPAPKKLTKREKRRQRLESAFNDYFGFEQALAQIPPHRVLAINRGERAQILRVRMTFNTDRVNQIACELLISENHPYTDFMRSCVNDALQRLIIPHLERDVRRDLTEVSEQHAVTTFARNLRALLLQPPVTGARVLAIDPGLKSGCKTSALDEFGNLLAHDTLYVVGTQEQRQQNRRKLLQLVANHQLTVIAIGNGIGCRETEELVAETIGKELSNQDIQFVVVNEAGTSVYSTSQTGKEELPQLDPAVRSALSIGRRLLDPLSELVKINPAHIGVGLYQHDMKAKHLRESLAEVVASCVNYVGVDLNTASPSLLRYVSGLNQLTARRLFEHREKYGPFKNRQQLKDVAGFGDVTFLQAAGFLKISQGDEPLDRTGIHPESYDIAKQILQKINCTADVVIAPKNTTSGNLKTSSVLADQLTALDTVALANELQIGEHLLKDILLALSSPSRDPREDLPAPIFRRGIMTLENLTPGMELSGTVLNVVDFGAFVDIGLADSGLVHISRLADRFIRDPHDILCVGDTLRLWILDIDKERRRVSLTAIQPGTEKARGERQKKNPRFKPDHDNKRPSQRKPRRAVKKTKYSGSRKSTGVRKHKSPNKPAKPITEAMVKGSAPMRSFSDLAQFFVLKESEGPEEAQK